MIRRFLRSLVNTALAEQSVPVLIAQGVAVATVEWRLWEVPAPGPELEPGEGWCKVTREPYAPGRWEMVAGLIGQGEQTPVCKVTGVYRHHGERSYVVELRLGDYNHNVDDTDFPAALGAALLATGWSALPADARRIYTPLPREIGGY